MAEREPRIPRLPRELNGSTPKHESHLKHALPLGEQENMPSNIEINLTKKVVTIDGNTIQFRGAISWKLMLCLARNANKDLSSVEVEEMIKDAGSGAKNKKEVVVANITNLRKKIELDARNPRVLTGVRKNSTGHLAYRFNANVTFIGREETEGSTRTFIFLDGIEISNLTRQDIEIARKIPLYPETIARSQLAVDLYGDVSLPKVKQKLNKGLSRLRKKVPLGCGWDIFSQTPPTGLNRTKGEETSICWKYEPSKARRSTSLVNLQQVDNAHDIKDEEEPRASSFTKEEIFVLANVLHEGNPELFKKNGFPFSEDRRVIIVNTINSLVREGLSRIDPLLVESEILPRLAEKLRSLTGKDILSMVNAYPILGLLVNLDRKQINSFVDTFGAETYRLTQEYLVKRQILEIENPMISPSASFGSAQGKPFGELRARREV